MKRSKKGSGYNLRKSLAWDRAFLTEEGILNSLELSMITGAACEVEGEGLSVINEQGREHNSDTIGGLTNLKTLEKDLFNKLPSGNLNETNATSSSFLKQVPSNHSIMASGSKFPRKIPPRSTVSSTSFKGGVTSTPMTPASQKRVLNLGGAKVMTRRSKIPKFPVSKHDTSLPSMTTSRTGIYGSSSKLIGVVQSAAQKNVGSKLLSSTEIASNGTKESSECALKSGKPSAENTQKDMAMTSLEMNLLRNHQAQPTAKISKVKEVTSNKRFSAGGADLIKSINRTSSSTTLPYHSSVGTESDRRDFQSHGIKPSGLRMPSPSLRFFSEPKAPVSSASSKGKATKSTLLKSSVPPSRNLRADDKIQDLKPAHPLQGMINCEGTDKSRLNSQMTDKYSAALVLDLTAEYKIIRDKQNPHEVEYLLPPEAATLKHTNNKPSRSQLCDVSGKECTSHLRTSLKDEDNNRMNDKLNLSCLESEEVTRRPSFVSLNPNENISDNVSELFGEEQLRAGTLKQANSKESISQRLDVPGYPYLKDKDNSRKDGKLDLSRLEPAEVTHRPSFVSLKTNESTSDDASKFYGEGQLSCASKTFKLVQLKLVEDKKHYSSAVMNVEIVQGIEANSFVHYNSLSLAANGEPSSNNFHEKPSEECMGVQIDGGHFLPDGSSQKLDEDDPVVLKSDGSDATVENSEGEKLHSSFNGVESPCQYQSILLGQLNEDAVQIDGTFKTSQCKLQPQCYDCAIIDSYALDKCASATCNQSTEAKTDLDSQDNGKHALKNELQVKELMIRRNVLDLNRATLLGHGTPLGKQEGRHTGIIGVDDVPKTFDKVVQIDLFTLLSNCGKDSIDQVSHLEFQSSAWRSEDQVAYSLAISDAEKSCSLDNKHELQSRHGLMNSTLEEHIEFNKPASSKSPTELHERISEHVLTGENKGDEKCSDNTGKEDTNSKLKMCEDSLKLNIAAPNALPFSDEWLAALEAAGEEILTMKTGTVQNSPPDKSTPEPSPWSPVKRKNNQEIGPFDCTKYKNTQQTSD